MAHDVFISRSFKDRATAHEVCATHKSHKIYRSIAPCNIRPGAEWDAAIVNGLAGRQLLNGPIHIL